MTHGSLVEFNLFVSEVVHLFERVDRHQNRSNVRLLDLNKN
jgi:hypothetical protein